MTGNNGEWCKLEMFSRRGLPRAEVVQMCLFQTCHKNVEHVSWKIDSMHGLMVLSTTKNLVFEEDVALLRPFMLSICFKTRFSLESGIPQDIAFSRKYCAKAFLAAPLTCVLSVGVWVPRLQGARKWNKTKAQSNLIVFAYSLFP